MKHLGTKLISQKEGKGVKIRNNGSHYYVCKVINHKEWIMRYKKFITSEELNEDDKRKFREKVQHNFFEIKVIKQTFDMYSIIRVNYEKYQMDFNI